MDQYDVEHDEDLQRHYGETRRAEVLAEFLKNGAMLPNQADGRVNQKLLKDYEATVEECLEAIRSIASRSTFPRS